MHKSRRLAILSLALVALVFTGAYALAGDGEGGDAQPAPAAPGDAPSAIETPESLEVPDAPDGGGLPELQVPEPSATPDDAGPAPTSTPGPSTPDAPVPAPSAAPTPQPTPAPPDDPIRGGGED